MRKETEFIVVENARSDQSVEPAEKLGKPIRN